MFIGIDLGTSSLKVIVLSDNGEVNDSAEHALSVQRPLPLYSEQDPDSWWEALLKVFSQLQQRQDLSLVKSIGFSGQMHGAVLLDQQDRVIRPAILWNDGRSEAQCKALEDMVKDSRHITGNIMMPGFTAPKLLWLKQHEPDNFKKIKKVLLPKDFLRLRLSGEYASEMSDAAGTLWLNTAKRQWDESLLSACGLRLSQMPTLFEGTQITGALLPSIAKKFGFSKDAVLVGGASDNAAGAIGMGLTQAGQAMLSLGTSGVYFVVNDDYSAKAENAVHSFCHALPNRWHLMSVILSAASCLQWFANNIVKYDLSTLMTNIENKSIAQNGPIFLPYLSGERTPHNNAMAKGAFFGLSHSCDTYDMLHAVLEGVSFALADGIDALHASGCEANDISLVGGGSKSEYWRQMLADVIGKPLDYREGGEVGPALGAARLAIIGFDKNRDINEICAQPKLIKTYIPCVTKHQYYEIRRQKYQALYQSTKTIF